MNLLRSAAIAVALLAVPMSGCAAIHAIGTQSVAASTLDDRALAEAESAYNVAVHAYNVARQNHLISPAMDAKLHPAVLKAHTVRLAAEKAFDAGNAADLNTQLNALTGPFGLLAQIKALTPSH